MAETSLAGSPTTPVDLPNFAESMETIVVAESSGVSSDSSVATSESCVASTSEELGEFEVVDEGCFSSSASASDEGSVVPSIRTADEEGETHQRLDSKIGSGSAGVDAVAAPMSELSRSIHDFVAT